MLLESTIIRTLYAKNYNYWFQFLEDYIGDTFLTQAVCARCVSFTTKIHLLVKNLKDVHYATCI